MNEEPDKHTIVTMILPNGTVWFHPEYERLMKENLDRKNDIEHSKSHENLKYAKTNHKQDTGLD